MSDNVYYEPEAFGLELIDSLDEDLSYEFNTLLVLRHHASGRFFYAQDSGCSCPTPFEDYKFNGPDDNNLTELTQANFAQFEAEFSEFPVPQHERDKFGDKVKAALFQSRERNLTK